jgi:High potential iron-sulfur protein
MGESLQPLNRRTFVKGIVVLPALASLFVSSADADASKASQSSMHYQNTPNGNMHCSLCKFFIPAQDAKSDGSCQIVDGSISPNGYCIAYSAK